MINTKGIEGIELFPLEWAHPPIPDPRKYVVPVEGEEWIDPSGTRHVRWPWNNETKGAE